MKPREFFFPPAGSVRPGRLLFLDGYRAVALILMVLVHGVNFWIDPAVNTPLTVALRKTVTGFPAPIFLMLVGASYILTREGRRKRGWSAGKIFQYCCRRSLVLLGVAYLYRASDMLFGIPWRAIKLGQVDVLNMIAVSFFLLAAADFLLHRFRWAPVAYLAVSWAFIILAPFSRAWQFPDFIPWYISSYINGPKPHSFFPIFPYANYVFFGAWTTHHVLRGALAESWKHNRTPVISLALAVVIFSWASTLLPPGFLAGTFFPKLAFYAKAQLLLLFGVWLCHWFQERVGFGPLLPAGGHTMAAYWIHAKLIFILGAPWAASAGWAGCGGLLAGAYALTIILTFAYINGKRKRGKKRSVPKPAAN